MTHAVNVCPVRLSAIVLTQESSIPSRARQHPPGGGSRVFLDRSEWNAHTSYLQLKTHDSGQIAHYVRQSI